MKLAEDLLELSQHLISRDVTRPKQANLRRAISTAYYALFHLLVAEAVQCILSPHAELMDRVSRSFQHGEMKTLCRQMQQAALPEVIRPLFAPHVSSELLFVAKSFIDLQEARHTADYDVGARFSRITARSHVETAAAAFQQWNVVQEAEARNFLTALAFGARWSR